MPVRESPADERRGTVLHEDERKRITRYEGPEGVLVRKEYRGPLAAARRHTEITLLERLAEVPGVPRLLPGAGPDEVLLAGCAGPQLRHVRLELSLVLGFARRLVTVVGAIHDAGVLHKYLNPESILVLGADRRPMVIDFDSASTFAEGRPGAAVHRGALDTLGFLPPECTGRTGQPVDHRADLYGVGAVLFWLVAGRPPVEGDDELRLVRDILVRVPPPLTELAPDVPPALADIVARLLEKEPDRRYQSAEGLARDLAAVEERPGLRFRLGAWDFPPRLVAPSRPVGRDKEVAQLRSAFAQASEGAARAVLIAGAPGVGKSSLVDALRPEVLARDGWFVVGKSDQFRQDAAEGAGLQAVRALGRRLLAETETDLAATRRHLLDVLGPNTGLVTGALPEFAVLLGAGHASVTTDPVEAEVRLRQALLDVLRVVVSPVRPVVLVVDDLQWAEPATLGLVDAVLTGSALPGLLVVGAFRGAGTDPTHPLTAMLQRWRHLGVAPPPLHLSNLPPTGLGALLTELLRLPAERAAALADTVREWTAGNPYDTLELINTLRHEDALVLGAHGWTWDDRAIRRVVSRGDVVDLLRERIDRLPELSRELLQMMACLGGDVRLEVLAAAAGDPAPDLLPGTGAVLQRLTPPLEDGLLVIDRDAGPDGDRVRFRHDRVHQAAYASLDPDRRTALHLALARRLARRTGRQVEAAEQYLAAAPRDTSPEETLAIIALYRTAATNAWRISNHATAERYLSAAATLWDTLGVAPDTPALIDLDIERHAALHALGRLDEADAVYASLVRRDPDPVTLEPAAGIQIGSLTQRNAHAEAIALGLDLIARLGHPVPGPDFPATLPARRAELAEWAAHLDLAADLARPEDLPPRVRATQRLFNRLLPTAFFVGDKVTLAWIVLESQRMWVAHGPSGGLAANLTIVGPMATAASNDYRIGYTVGRHVLAVAEARGYEPDTSVLRHRFALHLQPWAEPLENTVGQARLAREGLLRGGDLQMACNTSMTLLPARLDSGDSLQAFVAEIDAAVAMATRTANRLNVQYAAGYRQLADALMHGGGFTESEVAGNPLATGMLHICAAIAAAVLDDPAALDAHTARAWELASFIPGYPNVQLRFLRALALARGGPSEEFDRHLEWLDARAAEAPANVAHLAALVRAERADAAGDFPAALAAYDAAAREVSPRGRPWHHALIAERLGLFHLAHDLPRHGLRWLAEARDRYRTWGADAAVHRLEERHELPPPPRHTAPADESDADADRLDMLAILRASQALSSETNLERLHTAIVEQLTAITGATRVQVVLRNDDTGEWFLLAQAAPGSAGEQALPVEDAGRRGLLPITAFRYAERTREPLLVEDATRDDRFARDAYVAGLGRCSLLVVPVLHQGETRAVLMLANEHGSGAFTADRLDAVTLITGQLIVSLANAVLYGSLEERVADRTEALAAANRQLEVLSGTDALTGLANRRRFNRTLESEWSRALRSGQPLGLVLFDVDHFKRYNDHYGHVAGDECLRRVAATLAHGTRSATDLVCRYGGEEFAIVLPDADRAGATALGERARAAVAALALPHEASELGIVTVSAGAAAVVPRRQDAPEDLLGRADAALYVAKQDGRDRVRCAGP
ncbi:diguanylate cyclase domain-containing protein [Virgisporangium aliadipatigenens]|uniref:diguanylate cyclase domain-containing protein n=1 Tax=Virgisporangium aliadipatigenens TaxID=741659 RepID=UPI001944D9F1|nr:diguanylate cyclase [Virgisporangium aliadipatigenens]